MYDIGMISRDHRFDFPEVKIANKNNIEIIEDKELDFTDDFDDIMTNNVDYEAYLLEKVINIEVMRTKEDWELLAQNIDHWGFLLNMKSITENIKEIEFEVNYMTTDEQLSLMNFGDGFNIAQQQKFKNLVERYPRLFGEDLEDMRRIKIDPMKIQLIDSTPVKLTPYRVPLHQLTALKKEINLLKSLGLIVENTGPYSSPILMVKKKDGSWRLVVDYRVLNKRVKKEANEIPRINDLVDRAGGSSIFSIFDCRSGFWQWELSADSIEKTGFTTPFGGFSYVVCPMGFTNAAQGFHRVMTKILGDIVTVCAELIIDDVLVHSKSADQHLTDLEKMFSRCDKAQVLFRCSKIQVAKTEIGIWSWIINENGVRADPKKISQIKNALPPNNVQDVRSFIGLVQYYKRLIRGFSAIAAPLTDLMKGDGKSKVSLNLEQLKSFNTLRTILTEDLTIMHPNPEKQFLVKSDAGPFAVGGILSQLDDYGKERPVAFFSKKLNKYQINYGQTKKELLSAVITIRYWRHYLLGTNIAFKIVTDCTAVRDLLDKKELSGIFARWVMELNEYNFIVEYKRGILHTDADGMSRYTKFIEDKNIVEKIEDDFVEILGSDIYFGDAYTEKYDAIYNFLTTGDIPIDYSAVQVAKLKRDAGNYEVDINILYRRHKDGTLRRVVSTGIMAREILGSLHDSVCGGHFGVENTLKKIGLRYWWPKLGSDVAEYVKNCTPCQLRSRKRYVEPMPRLLAYDIFEKWGGDAIGPLPKSNGFQYIILFEH